MYLSNRKLRFIGVASVCLVIAACNPFEQKQVQPSEVLQDVSTNPEPATESTATLSSSSPGKMPSSQNKPSKHKSGSEFVAVTANPLASEAAYNILNQGGSAIDAAIAAQLVLGLVEPQSSGIGGGAFLLYWDAENKKLHSYDGRETAPSLADGSLFLDAAGQPLKFGQAIVGGRSVGVPGLLRMLETAHNQHGNLLWQQLFVDAIQLADVGFEVSPRLSELIQRVPLLKERERIRRYLHNGEEPLAQGSLLKNKNYAQSLKVIAENGANAFYSGALAKAMVSTVARDENGGLLSLSDLESYTAIERAPVCKAVLGYKICGMGPPSSGATTVLSILGQLEILLAEKKIAKGNSINQHADTAHAFIEASRLAFADRNTYLADPDFTDVPVEGLMDKSYLQSRAGLIDMSTRMERAKPGSPTRKATAAFVMAEGFDVPSTTHLSIVDAKGNIVSMTSSIESAFGSRLMTGGFLLNNQLTDFSFLPKSPEGGMVANRVEGGKRPLSSMSPIIIFNQSNEPVMAVGSPGGRSIIAYVSRVIYDHIVGKEDLYLAVSGKHVVETGRLRLEPGINQSLVQALESKGHRPEIKPQSSGVHALHVSSDGWVGVADPRREGAVTAK